MAADTYNKLMEMSDTGLYRYINGLNREKFKDLLMRIRKEQDRETRHACAESTIRIPSDDCERCGHEMTGCISKVDAHDACINAKAL